MLGRAGGTKQLVMRGLILLIGASFGILLLSFTIDRFRDNQVDISEKRVDILLSELGEPKGLHFISELDPEKVKKGSELVLSGRTTSPNGKPTKKQSRYFVCIDCHNVVREDPVLEDPNPESRLKYAVEHKIPFLQGTTLFGVVNREHWYNDDYLKKYGGLVAPARDTLVNAIQLCATTCSQGRLFEDWELEAVLHYLHSIGLTVKDLGLNQSEIDKVTDVNSTDKIGKSSLLKQHYSQISHATFLNPLSQSERKYGSNGSVDNGKLVYDNSCLHCHRDGGVTNFVLSHEKVDFSFLKKHLSGNGNKSVYYISRKGTYSINGYKPYMPNYTLERMSHQQLEDLAAYINQQASK
ncbi:MAG TPA: hypothetical protein DCF89_00920 [Flavobacteriales bacterium]|nr:hypothetical protein [Crocinitomicaceae bacterium]HAE29646.1 hypothetical protein [Flavobacteriales bacterium]